MRVLRRELPDRGAIKSGLKIFWFVPDLESARGLAQSKTWRKLLRSVTRVSVLECAGPPAAFPGQVKSV